MRQRTIRDQKFVQPFFTSMIPLSTVCNCPETALSARYVPKGACLYLRYTYWRNNLSHAVGRQVRTQSCSSRILRRRHIPAEVHAEVDLTLVSMPIVRFSSCVGSHFSSGGKQKAAHACSQCFRAEQQNHQRFD
jgi:hypothetical protein